MTETDIYVLLATFVLVLVIVWAVARLFAKATPTTIFDYQSGLLYRNGIFQRRLGPGRYWSWWPNRSIVVHDMREQVLTVPGQEMLTADNLTVRASLLVRYRVGDALKAQSTATEFYSLFYGDAQVVLRRAIAARQLETLLAERGEVGAAIMTDLRPLADRLGLEVLTIDIRDLALSGETKRAYADIFRARKDGEAALERARGETAALRSLANGARMLRDNPRLFDLRLLQTMNAPAGKGATIVVNTSGQPLTPVQAAGGPEPASEPES